MSSDSPQASGAPGGFLAPIRHVVPGLAILALTALASMAIGFYNFFALAGNHGDIHILFFLAATVYPGPYFLYAFYCFFLFHAYRSMALTLAFYVSCALMAIAPFVAVAINLGTPGLSLPQRLDSALWFNFYTAVAIGFVFAGIQFVLARSFGSRRHSETP